MNSATMNTPSPSLVHFNKLPNMVIATSQRDKSIAQAQARAAGPAGVSNKRTPSGVVRDNRPDNKLDFH